MKIALLSPWLVKCGVSSYNFYLANALAEQDCEVYVVRLYRFGQKDENYYRHYAEEVPLDVDVVHLQHEYGIMNWLELVFYSALRTRMKMFNKELPIVTTMHSAGNLRVDRIIRNYSSEVIVHNLDQARMFKLACQVIPMGIQRVKEPPPPDLAKRRWGIKPLGKTVGMFGFLSEYKGLEVLIQAVSKLEDVTLLVGGGWHVDVETPYMTNIRLYASHLAPGRVRWLGYLEEEDLPYYFGACDVMVFAHHMISESMALNTALAYGKATLASHLPAFREKAERNVLMTFKNVDDLTGKLKALLTENELRELLEKNAQKHALDNSWLKVAQLHVDLYESLLKEGGE